MRQIFYHASHEQFSPRELLNYARLAEVAGFHGCHSSDHFHPWSERQGQSGHLYSWLGAVLEATQFPIHFITTPGQRYHPAVVAQAIATLAQMYPARICVELGSGEALNEHITGEKWPSKTDRNARLEECADVIRRLLAGDAVNHHGLIKVSDARLYTLPEVLPNLFAAAITEKTSAWAGSWADGLITTHRPVDQLKKIVHAFRQGGGEGKPVHIKLTFCYDRDEQIAKQQAYDQWRSNCIAPEFLANLRTVKDFDQRSSEVTLEDVMATIPVVSDKEIIFALIEELFELGIDVVVVHNVNRNQTDFIEDFKPILLQSGRFI